MSWGIVETVSGPLLLAIGRDISERRAAEMRLRAVAAMGERALAGADPADLAHEAVELMRVTLPVSGAEVRLGDGDVLAADGPSTEMPMRLTVGAEDELVVWLERELSDDEMSFLRAIANTLATALARLRTEDRMRHEALHDPLTGLANRTLLRDRLEHALARSAREDARDGRAVRRPRRLQGGQRRPRPRGRRRGAGRARRAPARGGAAGRHRGAARRRRVRGRVRGGRRGRGDDARRPPARRRSGSRSRSRTSSTG